MTEVLQSAELWVLAAFIIFVVGMYTPISRAVSKALDTRIDTIRSQVEDAEHLRAEAQTALASYQRKQRQAAEEAEAMVEQARKEAERHREEAGAALKTLLERQEAQALEKIAQAEALALQEVRELAVDLAISTAGQLLTEKLKGSQGNFLIDDAIKNLPKKLN